MNSKYWGTTKNNKEYLKLKPGFEPRQPASVVDLEEEEKTTYGISKEECKNSIDESVRYNGNNFEPPNPASVVESEEPKKKDESYYEDGKNPNVFSKKAWKGTPLKLKANMIGGLYEPLNPVSVLEEPAEDEPVSMFESTKVFIGKRHHQTEKPQDILEFFLKYWTEEGETVLDPTMGSGSTGVACKKLGRNFIGYEMDEKIFNVAKTRIEK